MFHCKQFVNGFLVSRSSSPTLLVSVYERFPGASRRCKATDRHSSGFIDGGVMQFRGRARFRPYLDGAVARPSSLSFVISKCSAQNEGASKRRWKRERKRRGREGRGSGATEESTAEEGEPRDETDIASVEFALLPLR